MTHQEILKKIQDSPEFQGLCENMDNLFTRQPELYKKFQGDPASFLGTVTDFILSTLNEKEGNQLQLMLAMFTEGELDQLAEVIQMGYAQYRAERQTKGGYGDVFRTTFAALDDKYGADIPEGGYIADLLIHVQKKGPGNWDSRAQGNLKDPAEAVQQVLSALFAPEFEEVIQAQASRLRLADIEDYPPIVYYYKIKRLHELLIKEEN